MEQSETMNGADAQVGKPDERCGDRQTRQSAYKEAYAASLLN